MAARNVSPGGALLRTSRLFTLPGPIPPPPDHASGGRFHSDTSTLPFPRHQVITTTESSRKRGDWGFKRALPLKSTTKSSNPMIRVRQVDTVEHVTDFSSAGDHGVTLRKFQELNIPLSVPTGDGRSSSRYTPRVSVFEESGDFTAIDQAKELEAAPMRWKFRGPWLAGMTQGDFKKWISKSVRTRRPEFREFLRRNLAQVLTLRQTARASSDEDGLGGEVAQRQIKEVRPEEVTEEQLSDYLRALRMDRGELYRLVGQFLDLAPLQPPEIAKTMEQQKALGALGSYTITHGGNPYATNGPPITHPSAGLSYLRTNAFLDNHPVYGPQKHHPPVEARVVMPRPAGMMSGIKAKLGVAGFIVESPGGETSSNMMFGGGKSKKDGSPEYANLSQFNPNIEGGAKMWVQPSVATVSAQGRVMLDVLDANTEAVDVAKELIGQEKLYGKEKKPEDQKRGLNFSLESFKIPKKGDSRRPLFGSASAYGFDQLS